jgi:hypothetical protein
MKYENWSYGALAEFGIEVCASCGGANLNSNHKKKSIKSLPVDWCFDCLHNEGSTICMPDDDVFYPQAKKTLNKLKKKESK